ncbi:YceI family protein [Rhodococcus rhodnii]|uniref:YceI family protein n=2 Tax=Rhodococcus rhodnii TaxID=38312 RepID=A0A6P2CA52_9NOCA|nr:YceI family protein [Rhodococcus rhodnii]EOM74578.1 putative secreted protein [Rhodococcus rhodnii LMG 5362]TXG89425.1 YceI family protein [Rhodococcus rhodnii]
MRWLWWPIALAALAVVVAVIGPWAYSRFVVGETGAAASFEVGGNTGAPQPGRWVVVTGAGGPQTQVGYTARVRGPGAPEAPVSGSTGYVSGSVILAGDFVMQSDIAVDVTTVTSDSEQRDNIFRTLLAADADPVVRFVSTEPIDIGSVPLDGRPGTVTAAGELIVAGQPHPVRFDMQVLRPGAQLVVAGSVPVRWSSFLGAPLASGERSVEDAGTIDVRLTFARG